jgi:hypothetical protein
VAERDPDDAQIEAARADIRLRLSTRAAAERAQLKPGPRRASNVLDLNAVIRECKANIPSPEEQRRRQEERGSLNIPCAAHNAEAGLWCSRSTGIIVCPHRLGVWQRSRAERRGLAETLLEARAFVADELERAGVPDEHLRLVRAGSWDPRRPTFQQAEAFHAGSARAVVFGGATGKSKSGAAARLLELGPRRDGGVAWVEAPRLNMIPLFVPDVGWQLPRGQRFPPLIYPEILAARRVVFDDVGAAVIGDPDINHSRLVDLLQHLLDAEADVIITTNGSWSGLQKWINAPQIWARLRAWAVWHRATGTCDRRKEGNTDESIPR